MRGMCDNEEGDFNREHPFPRVSGYERSEIEGDIMEARVSYIQ